MVYLIAFFSPPLWSKLLGTGQNWTATDNFWQKKKKGDNLLFSSSYLLLIFKKKKKKSK